MKESGSHDGSDPPCRMMDLCPEENEALLDFGRHRRRQDPDVFRGDVATATVSCRIHVIPVLSEISLQRQTCSRHHDRRILVVQPP